MFFDLVRKNSRRNRKENGIFFLSLVIAIVAFYIILNLENQDVIHFLREMESDAVAHLLRMVPLLYGFSLFLIFFLIYYAGKYQLERRSHELGMYLMMGMRKGKLAQMLILEDLWSSAFSLAVGIPVAILISECISLLMAKLVGIGIIGHRFTFSFRALFLTIAGYVLVKLFAFFLLSIRFASRQIGTLLADRQEEPRKKYRKATSRVQFLTGMVLIVLAYVLAIRGNAWISVKNMGLCMLVGIIGTFLLFFGLRSGVELLGKRESAKDALHRFTFRQLQENIIQRPGMLAVVSLLVLFAVCCFGYGVSMGWQSKNMEIHNLDYTFRGNADEALGKRIQETMRDENIKDYVGDLFEVRTVMLTPEDMERGYSFDWGTLMDSVKASGASQQQETLQSNLEQIDYPYLFAESDYNHILLAAGKEQLHLGDHEAALFCNKEFANGESGDLLRSIMKEEKQIHFAGETYRLIPGICEDDIVVDRFITISYAVILPDWIYNILYEDPMILNQNSYWNMVLNPEKTEQAGLMQTISEVNALLDQTGLEYESYLQNLGRQIFYVVAGSYTTLYLAIIFLIIANTVLSVQFLMQQQRSGRRYRILSNLGATYEMLCHSARRQIRWYFALPVGVAVLSSFFGVKALLTGMLPSNLQEKMFTIFAIAVTVILVLCVVECIYLLAVMRVSDRHIHELMQVRREEE